jgi:SAM-dependent methyltransferase
MIPELMPPKTLSTEVQVGPCQVCARQDPQPFYDCDGVCLLECRGCGLIFMNPMPTPAQVTEIYNDLYGGATTGYFAKVGKKMVRNRRRISSLRRHVRGGRFLDVGCNGGFMVETAREAGFKAFGVELDPASIDYARKRYPQNTFFLGSLEELVLTETGFDLVYCSEVIEHVLDLNGFVASLARAMAPEGILYITSPDISHWRRPRDLKAWDGFDPPAHCVYFNPTSLTKLLASHGLEVFRKQFAWKPGIKFFARKRKH